MQVGAKRIDGCYLDSLPQLHADEEASSTSLRGFEHREISEATIQVDVEDPWPRLPVNHPNTSTTVQLEHRCCVRLIVLTTSEQHLHDLSISWSGDRALPHNVCTPSVALEAQTR